MKKIIRAIAITVSSLIVIYGVFVGVDCVRLYKSKTAVPPLIVTNSTVSENGTVKYTGLGYTVTYKTNYADTENRESTNITDSRIYGAGFRMFDKILFWAWIE
ncbi:MAG: hypothetical protein ACI4VW_07170 [Acutalibacteraceae bacterium]